MSSHQRHYADSSSYTYNAANVSVSSSRAGPHYRLPDQYQARSSSSHQYAPADYRGNHYPSSSSSHMTPPAGYRDNFTVSSSSHQSPPRFFRDTFSTSSTRQTYYPPIVSNNVYDDHSGSTYTEQGHYHQQRHRSSGSTTGSASTKRESLTLGDARDQVFRMQQRLRDAQTAVQFDEIYDNAQNLRSKFQYIERQDTMSIGDGVTPMDDMTEEIDDIMSRTRTWRRDMSHIL